MYLCTLSSLPCILSALKILTNNTAAAYLHRSKMWSTTMEVEAMISNAALPIDTQKTLHYKSGPIYMFASLPPGQTEYGKSFALSSYIVVYMWLYWVYCFVHVHFSLASCGGHKQQLENLRLSSSLGLHH